MGLEFITIDYGDGCGFGSGSGSGSGSSDGYGYGDGDGDGYGDGDGSGDGYNSGDDAGQIINRRFQMKSEVEVISINGVEYIPKNCQIDSGSTKNEYVIVRTYSAGVFAGNMEKRCGREVVLTNARRIWYWDGAASLSQLAMEGTKKPENCKFPCPVDRVELTEVIEVLICTEKARKSIQEVPIWER